MTDTPPSQQPKARFTFKGLLLYFLPSPLILALLFSVTNMRRFITLFVVLILFYSAAHLNRQTQKQLRLYYDTGKLPTDFRDHRKLAMWILGAGVLLLVLLLISPRLFLLAGLLSGMSMLGFYLSYGLPSHSDKLVYSQSRQVEQQTQQVADQRSEKLATFPESTQQILVNAQHLIVAISEQGESLVNTDNVLAEWLGKVAKDAQNIWDLLLDTPNNMGQARKFLQVYLNRINEIGKQYQKLNAHAPQTTVLRDQLLDTLHQVHLAFTEHKAQLLRDDQIQLEVQLEVLQKQLDEH